MVKARTPKKQKNTFKIRNLVVLLTKPRSAKMTSIREHQGVCPKSQLKVKLFKILKCQIRELHHTASNSGNDISEIQITIQTSFSLSRTGSVKYRCIKTTDFSCHRCLINTGSEKNEQHLNRSSVSSFGWDGSP